MSRRPVDARIGRARRRAVHLWKIERMAGNNKRAAALSRFLLNARTWGTYPEPGTLAELDARASLPAKLRAFRPCVVSWPNNSDDVAAVVLDGDGLAAFWRDGHVDPVSLEGEVIRYQGNGRRAPLPVVSRSRAHVDLILAANRRAFAHWPYSSRVSE